MAVIVTDASRPPHVVVAVNDALVLPAGTVTDAGTVTYDELSDSVTTAPPVGAAPVSVTVPCEGLPPVTLAGLKLTELRVAAAGVTVSVAVRVTPL